MSYIDNDLKRLLKYAESLGIKVSLKQMIKGAGQAEWDMHDRSITIYTSNSMSKTKIILSLLHELGHHLDWIYNDKQDTEEAHNAYRMLNEGHMFGDRSDVPKRYRDIIYREEKAGVHYMSIIHKELDLKIPKWKVKLQQHLDLYDYEVFMNTGSFPTYQEYKIYKQKIKPKYKRLYGKKKK